MRNPEVKAAPKLGVKATPKPDPVINLPTSDPAMLKSEVRDLIRTMAETNGGRITPAEVVEAAKPEDSVLHPYFTWDDTEAARKCREDEARVLIRSVRVVITTQPFITKAPAFVHDPRAFPFAGYISVGKLRSDEEASREAVGREFAQAAAALKRAREVGAALGLSDEIDALIATLETIKVRALQAAA